MMEKEIAPPVPGAALAPTSLPAAAFTNSPSLAGGTAILSTFQFPTSEFVTSLMNLSTANLQQLLVLQAKLVEATTENARLFQEVASLRNSVSTPVANSPTSTTPISDFTTFECFPRLPIELRIKVWKNVIRKPRVVEVRRVLIQRFHNGYPATDWEFRVFNNSPPSVIHVNQESRNEALRYYKLGSLNSQQYETYLNINNDILYLAFDWDLVDRWQNSWEFSLTRDGWDGRWINRVAISLPSFGVADPEMVEHFALMGAKEIIVVEQRGVEDCQGWYEYGTNRETCHTANLSNNLDLISLSPHDVLKPSDVAGTGYDADFNYGLETVGKYVTMTQKELKITKDEMLPLWEPRMERYNNSDPADENRQEFDPEDYHALVAFDPSITVMRMKFSETHEKESKVVDGESRDVDRKRKITRSDAPQLIIAGGGVGRLSSFEAEIANGALTE